MRVRSKILIPPIILTVLAAGAILVSNVFQFSGYVDETSEASVDIAAAVAQKNLDSYFIESQTAAMYVAGDRGISAAMAILDRDALISRASGLLSSISPDFCTISDASGTVVARTHDPDEFGDSIANQKNIQAAIAGNSYSGLEQGAIVGLSVRASARVLDAGGEFIGIVSIGFRLDTDTFVDELKDITHCEATVFLGDTRISTTVLNADGTRAIGVKASDAYRDTVLGGVRFIGKTDVVGRNALASYSPIMNNEGETIGILSVAHYIDNSTATIMAFVQSGMLIMILMLALTVGVLLFVAKAISNPLRSMVSSATAVAGGDLTRQVEVATRDEVRELGDAFNDMVAKNHDVFLKIRASANSVANGSQQIASSSQALAQGATQQAAAVQELSSSMSDISDRTKSNVQIAEQAAKLAEAVKDSANRGSAQMDEMMAAVKQIHDASQSISKVINTIDDIAFQTNILALNAAVEAARAGTHGKGFAVVAEEVRNLAAKSAEAASDTESLIANSMQKAELGVRIASETSESLMEIVNGINESNELVLEIARSSEQQSGEISQINTGIEQVAQVVQHNSATAEESAAAADEMKGQSAVLQHLVSQFKLDEGQSALPSASDYEDDLLLAPYDDGLAM